jgi:ribosomal protein L11 methylase PrmA
MFSVTIAADPEQHDRIIAELWDAGTLGVIEGDGVVEAFFDDAETAARFGPPRKAHDVDWVRQTEDAWPPLLVGEKFFIVAPWRTEPTPRGRFRLEINPGQQCGTLVRNSVSKRWSG